MVRLGTVTLPLDSTLDKHTLVAGFPTTIPNTVGGTRTTTITRDSAARLWTTWPSGAEVRYSISDDAGAT